jgi:hypothetical protein
VLDGGDGRLERIKYFVWSYLDAGADTHAPSFPRAPRSNREDFFPRTQVNSRAIRRLQVPPAGDRPTILDAIPVFSKNLEVVCRNRN